MTYAAIHVPEFPSVACMLRTPGIRNTAFAVVEGDPPLERIVSFNQEAEQLGLEHGISKVQAEAAGSLSFHPRSSNAEIAARQDIVCSLDPFSPRIQVLPAPAGYPVHLAVLLDYAGMATLYGDASRYGERIATALQTAGYPVHVAIAPNAEAALLLASCYPGITCVDDSTAAGMLAPLPVAALRCEQATLDIFARWGIHTLGELAALPEQALVSRLGQQAQRLQQLARGRAEFLLVPEQSPLELAERYELDSPIDLLESLLFVLSPMLERLLARAVEHAYAIQSVALTLELEKAPPHRLQIRPALPTQHRELLLKLINLELQAHPPGAAIEAVVLSAEPAQPSVAQRGLFQTQFPDPGKLDVLLARLEAIAAGGFAGAPELLNSHRAGEFRVTRFFPVQQSTRSSRSATQSRLALRRLNPPRSTRVLMRNKKPQAMDWQGVQVPIASASGPWHSSGYWWDNRHWEVEEWDSVTLSPSLLVRLVYEPGSGNWFIAGVYD